MIAMTTNGDASGDRRTDPWSGAILLYSLIIGRGAKAKAQLILDEAERDAEAKLKDAEVSIKEMELKREAEAERKLSKSREEIHQRERALDKREAQFAATSR